MSANFDPVEVGTGWINGVDNLDGTYTITHALVTPVGEGTFVVNVEATNISGTSSTTVDIRLGQAPTFSGWAQSPTAGNVGDTDNVDVDIEINDNGGAANVQADLVYQVDGGSWVTNPMSYAGGTHWDGTIPAQASGAHVDYIINATDLLGNWASDAHSYDVETLGSDPELVPGSESIHEPGFPGNVYNETPGYGAPQDELVNYQVEIDTSNMPASADYVIVVSAFDPIRDCFLDVNASVTLDNSTNVIVTLQLTFPSIIVAPGTLIYGKIYVLTDLPSNGGTTITWIAFTHLFE